MNEKHREVLLGQLATILRPPTPVVEEDKEEEEEVDEDEDGDGEGKKKKAEEGEEDPGKPDNEAVEAEAGTPKDS